MGGRGRPPSWDGTVGPQIVNGRKKQICREIAVERKKGLSWKRILIFQIWTEFVPCIQESFLRQYIEGLPEIGQRLNYSKEIDQGK